MTRWFEDVNEGEVFPLGEHTFTQDAIVTYAKIYDPQYFHVDPEAAQSGPFGGLVASGAHTAMVGQRKMVDALFAEAERLRALGQEPGIGGPSPGGDSIAFTAPVRPGDTLTYVLTTTGKRASNSLPGWGLLTNEMTATNQRGELVYRASFASFLALRGDTGL
ncbi:MaoC/PaaZ C-terminal domain-containing protein [uncultured Devosia sp.]|uniref:MaoC/PaaZ C-terminal domain-containing protein n=1 Tax=uncultured Devosia sp. TaxID=211434 RepID=UPI0035CA3860